MNESISFQKFELKKLATVKPLFDLRFFSDVKPLQSSVQIFGVLKPPYLYRAKDDIFVVDGYYRLKFAKQKGYSQIGCYFSEEDDISSDQLFLRYIELNRWSRNFNLVEKALLIKKAHQVFQGKAIPKAFWSMVDVPQKIHVIQNYKNLLKLPEFILKYMVNNNLSLKTGLSFLKFSKEEAEKLATQLFVYPLNQNKLIEILELLYDLKKREERSAVEILGDVLQRLSGEIRSPHQKEQYLREELKRRKNPHYEQQMASFQQKVKRIPLHPEISLNPAPFFEDDYVEVRTKIYTQEDIQKLIHALNHQGWEDLLKL